MATENLEAGFTVQEVTPARASQPVHVVVVEQSLLVDGPVLDAFGQRLASLQAEHPRLDLLIDLGAVDLMSSSAIGLLGMQHRKVWNSKGRMKLCAIRPRVMEVLRISRLADYFDIYATRAEALASF